ncbi:hypothetical protein M2323_003907 [Rhodoblastus acidophilus]|uniref:hypothetical protein n=1 Tax=Rhodoblastus acidophilus TaxID=1074 RepID=UPI002224073E|nr:hypothetical protein [Rhodoblastus acidophilus]MCW2286070.1 hypothetical protein [Rhodoblastus acidophilus]MCW2334964.1 hypothetical protein [Rhodoblastus acidophilus]
MQFVKLGEDEDGDPFGACYVEPGKPEDAVLTVKRPKEKGPPGHAKADLDALGVVIGDKGHKVRPFGTEGPEVTAVDRETIREEFNRVWAADGADEKARSDAKRKAFKRGEEWASSRRLTASREVGRQHLVWLLKDADP